MNARELIDKLENQRCLRKEEYVCLLDTISLMSRGIFRRGQEKRPSHSTAAVYL